MTGTCCESSFFDEVAPSDEDTPTEEDEEREKCGGWRVGDTSILATSSTMLLDAIWTRALEELLLELDAISGPDEAADEEEEEEEEEVVVLCDSTEAGLLRL